LNCMYNTFLLHCLKYSVQCTHCNECCANSSNFMLLRSAPTASMQITSVKSRLILTMRTTIRLGILHLTISYPKSCYKMLHT
jgi:hypothetical protein